MPLPLLFSLSVFEPCLNAIDRLHDGESFVERDEI